MFILSFDGRMAHDLQLSCFFGPSGAMSIACYTQRQMNPFRGVVNVIRYQSAEAVTLDGVCWGVYVAALREGLKGKSQISVIRYGIWSEAAGLKRGPIYPAQPKAAQVEMVLRQRQPAVQDKIEPDTSPFYMATNPAGGEYT